MLSHYFRTKTIVKENSGCRFLAARLVILFSKAAAAFGDSKLVSSIGFNVHVAVCIILEVLMFSDNQG